MFHSGSLAFHSGSLAFHSGSLACTLHLSHLSHTLSTEDVDSFNSFPPVFEAFYLSWATIQPSMEKIGIVICERIGYFPFWPDLSDFPFFAPPKTHVFHLSWSEIWLTALEKGTSDFNIPKTNSSHLPGGISQMKLICLKSYVSFRNCSQFDA